MAHRALAVLSLGLSLAGVASWAWPGVATAAESMPDMDAALARAPKVPTSRIANGKVAKECAMPVVVSLKMGNICTGTLIHPQVVLYAAHCGRLQKVIVGEDGNGPVVASVAKSIVNPLFSKADMVGPKGTPIDWAVGVLGVPITGLPLVPVAHAREVEHLVKVGARVIQAGYGRTERGIVSKQLRWVSSEIGEVGEGMIVTAKSEKNACPGDSGGPLLAQMPDNTWRVVGIASTLNPDLAACGEPRGFNRYSQVRPDMIKWLEEQSGIDLTPCYDQAGNLDKSSACTDFFAGDIENPSGSWDNNCADAKVVREPQLMPNGGGDGDSSPEDSGSGDSSPEDSGSGDSSPEDSGSGDSSPEGSDSEDSSPEDSGSEDSSPDTKSPEIRLKTNDADEVLEPGDKRKFIITAKDDQEVVSVELLLDGNRLKRWRNAEGKFSHTWTAEEPGEYEFVAVAKDASGNEARSETIELDVEEPPEDSKEPSGIDPEMLPCSVQSARDPIGSGMLGLALLGLAWRRSTRCRINPENR